jgi:hypothetical protein
MRYYITDDAEHVEGFPTLFVVEEVIGWRDHNGSVGPYMGEDAVTEDELRAMPGGADALERWKSRDDSVYEALTQAWATRAHAEDDYMMTLSPVELWDYDAEKFGREVVESMRGPRPINLQAV